MSSIEGLGRLEKEGWELVRVGKLMPGDYWLNGDGLVVRWEFPHQSSATNYLIIRKKPKQYRPFANAAEFEPHRDRWIRRSHARKPDAKGCYKISAYDDWGVFEGGSKYSFKDMLDDGRHFDDGAPFGVEVKENELGTP